MSMFDPAAFLDATISETNEKRPPLLTENPASPDGLYTAMIGEITPKSGEKDGKPWMAFAVPLKIDVPQQLQDSLKLPPQITLTDRVFLDLTDQGLIDNTPGKNRGQKKYRDATGMNSPGQVFSWRKLVGQPVKVKITHDMYEGAIQERVGDVVKI